MDRSITISGTLRPVKVSASKAPLSWRISNTLRRSYISGAFVNWLARVFTRLTNVRTLTSELSGKLKRADGTWLDFGILSYKLVTDTGVGFLVDDWDSNVTDISTMKYHGVGLGVVAEAQTDAALGTESTTILNPDSTRATGTISQPAANQMRSVGTVTFDGAGAITEHGLLSQAATAGGVLWDRSVFAAINVASGDSIQFTYTLTINAGG